jgi:uncharacterized protein (TIGR02246 family)
VTAARVRAALDAFDRAFAAGDAAALAEQFADDARLLLLHADAMEGRDAIRSHWNRLFERYDTSAWRTELLVIDVHGGQAWTVSTYSEILVARDVGEGSRQLVRGRLVRFLGRVSLALNSHSRPVELLD